MALVCPVGHPSGVGTPYCRLCGRDYVETAEAPVLVAVAEPPPPVPEPPTQVLPVPVPPAPGVTEPPELELPVQPGPRHAADALPEDEPLPEPEPDASPAVAMVERRLLTLVAAATFVGGLVVGGGAVAFLG